MSNINSFAALADDFKPVVPPKPSATKYVPPSQRKEQEKKDAEDGKIDLNSAELFPTLGGAAVAKTATTAGNKSFKQKIDDLIAFEQLTEAEKLEREEEARKMEGFVILPLPKTAAARSALCERFHEMLEQQTEDPDILYHTMHNPPQWKPNAAPLTTSKLHKVVEEYDDFSDHEDDFESNGIHHDWMVDCA